MLIGPYRHRPLHLFGGIALGLLAFAVVIAGLATALGPSTDAAILLCGGLVLTGVLFSAGLLAELIVHQRVGTTLARSGVDESFATLDKRTVEPPPEAT